MLMNLKLLRIKNHLSQNEMAKQLDVSRATYNKIENGQSNGSIRFWLNVKKVFPDVEIEQMTEREVTQ